MEMTLTGYVYAKWEDWKDGWSLDFYKGDEVSTYLIGQGHMPIQRAVITFDMPDAENLRLLQLRKQKEAIVAEYKARIESINEQISNFEALPMPSSDPF